MRGTYGKTENWRFKKRKKKNLLKQLYERENQHFFSSLPGSETQAISLQNTTSNISSILREV